MSLQIEPTFLSNVLKFLSYLLPLMIGSMISGIFVTIDRSGRIRASNGRFISFPRALIFVIADLVLCALLASFVSDIVLMLLYQYIMLIPAISCTVFFSFTIWFCHSFGFKLKRRKGMLAVMFLIIFFNVMAYFQKIYVG